ncbi:MAG: hypothetical protein JW837_18880 [Sedimentisphaerales bacterium]|nr:hypothetical protein [Sedimentisphaerales bacterium]
MGYSSKGLFSLSSRENTKISKLFPISLVICLYITSVFAKYEGGNGTAANPYLISTAEQLNEIGTNPGHWNKHFKLIADINMNDANDMDFNIIEDFTGIFDGNDCTISNLGISSTLTANTGLFGTVGGEISNLGLINPNIIAQGGNVGSLIGFLNHGIITNCYARGAVVSGSTNIGGLIGLNTGRVTLCWSSGNVSGDSYVGGLTGLIDDGKLQQCCSRADVSANSNVGGLAGKTTDESSEVMNCYATGTVEGDRYVGGLVGQVEQGRVYKCYSAGSVTGNRDVGGLTGFIRVLGDVSRSYWDTQTSGQETSAGGSGKTTSQMKKMDTYLAGGWDFWATWTICEDINYPTLLSLIPVSDLVCPDGVNFIDFAVFASQWGNKNCSPSNSNCQGADINQSGIVDFWDLEIFAKHWLEGLD